MGVRKSCDRSGLLLVGDGGEEASDWTANIEGVEEGADEEERVDDAEKNEDGESKPFEALERVREVAALREQREPLHRRQAEREADERGVERLDDGREAGVDGLKGNRLVDIDPADDKGS